MGPSMAVAWVPIIMATVLAAAAAIGTSVETTITSLKEAAEAEATATEEPGTTSAAPPLVAASSATAPRGAVSEAATEPAAALPSTASAAPPLLLNKCCGYHERLDHKQRECIVGRNVTQRDLIQETMATLRAQGKPWWMDKYVWRDMKKARAQAVVRYGTRPCDREVTSMLWKSEVTLFLNGSLNIKLRVSGSTKKTNVTLSPEDYCVDTTILGGKTYFVYLTCPCGRVPCVRKCCDYMRMLTIHPPVAMSRSVDCDAPSGNRTWNISLFSDAQRRAVSNASYALLRGPFPLQCGPDALAVSLDSKDIENADIAVLSNGSLVAKAPGTPYSPQDYCVAIAKSPTGVERLWALACAKKSPPKPMSALDKVYVALYAVGMTALAATLAVYALLPSLRRPANAKALMCHTAALAVAMLTLCVSRFVKQVHRYAYCASLAFVAQFFLLATFCWLSVLCLDIARAFSTSLRPADCSERAACRRMLLYSLFAWGSPAVIVAVSAYLNFAPGLTQEVLRPDIGKQGCWFKKGNSVLAYYYGPVAVLLSVNVALFCFTMMRLRIAQREVARLKNGDGQLSGGALRRRRERLLLYAKLFSLMGVTWVLEVVAWAAGADRVTVLVIDSVNVLRGVGVFAATCCKGEVLSALRDRLAACCCCGAAGGRALGRERGLSYTVSSTLGASAADAVRLRRMTSEEGY